ncbi:hypothetical protein LOTGIDRAFT_168323 [Lottia gigantea]|uniref:Uncharacterized protein n=1 Tax=Lottia gigantea TaxID=225164 RepID=V3ZQR4_LOTGI|nr:hypothetical protein LOTGIDRAFT_168323 [Lottia gigantea]ESO84835.1 hypothetical protein LOTGIDRAFT_168323 [Lottia gigantea]
MPLQCGQFFDQGRWEVRQYCYDSTIRGCEEHILDCEEEQVISIDIPNFHVSYYKNKNYPECQTEKDECKNKPTCCRYINSSVTIRATRLTANDGTKLINFIKTECSFKSSCKTSFYSIGSLNLYDYIKYTYGCVLVTRGNVTIDCKTIEYGNKQAEKKTKESETNLAGIIGGTVGGLVVLVVIVIIIVVLVNRRRRRRPKDKVNENNYYSTVDDDSKGNSNYTYIDVDLDKVGYSKINNPGANQVKGSHAKDKNPKEEKRKNSKFKRQDFSFVERNFEKMNESKDARKRNVPNATANPERKEESEPANYTYIDDSIIKAPDTPSASAAKDGGQRNAAMGSSTAQYTKVDMKKVKFIPTNDNNVNLDNYNHIGLKDAPPKNKEQDPDDNYNHINSNFKNENSLPKGSNSNPSSNYNYTEIDRPQEDVIDDTYDQAQQGGERILNQRKKKELRTSDTYNHIGITNDNSLFKGANSEPDTYNHIGIKNGNSVYEEAEAMRDTYNHISVKNDNSVSKGAQSEPDTYNHIGINNDNSVSKGAKTFKPIQPTEN